MLFKLVLDLKGRFAHRQAELLGLPAHGHQAPVIVAQDDNWLAFRSGRQTLSHEA